MSFTTIRMAVGRVVLIAGVLVLLFIPYLLWGTGLLTAQSQARLRAAFSTDQKLAKSVPVKPPVVPRKDVDPEPVQVAQTIAAPPAGSPVGTIVIPKIGLSMVVVEGTDTAQLEQGPGHYPGTPLPGEAGNAAIAGHRTTYLRPFYNLDALAPGDQVVVTTLQGIFVYSMTQQLVVSPTDVAVVDPTLSPELTLTTCNPRFSASQRLVVHAALVASALAHRDLSAVPATVSRHHTTPALDAAPDRDWLAASLWGVAAGAFIAGVWIVAGRTRRGTRASVIVLGVLAWLVVVFFFFQSVAPLLPADF
ncbi:MAG: class E sortase [Acidimicrobiales bacterium]